MAISYYKITKILRRWEKVDGARIIDNVSLSMDRPPPKLRKIKAPAQKEPKEKEHFLIKLMEMHEKVTSWFEPPPKLPVSPKPSLPKPSPPKKEKTLPPFDIQDMPEAMRSAGLPVSAKLLERWLSGELNYSPTDAEVKAEINQDGNPYPPSMYDTDTVKMKWVRSFPRAEKQFEYLVNTAIRSPNRLLKYCF